VSERASVLLVLAIGVVVMGGAAWLGLAFR
jgi:hypothetical protein